MSKNWLVRLYPKDSKPYNKIITARTLTDVIYTLESKDGFDIDLGSIKRLEAEEIGTMV
ncbi:MAG: hypothetical protein Q8910_00695 [Bacteroidota bacterium]|nr:hypothetical protein [Bacteroidota bacterium]